MKGEFLRMGKVVNNMVAQLGTFASEVIRVAREVGTDGKLGGQAKVKGVSGTWKDLTESLKAAYLLAQPKVPLFRQEVENLAVLHPDLRFALTGP